MTIFIWNNVGNLTDNYHDDGGLVVIAASLDAAKVQIENACQKGCTALKDTPDFQASVEANEEKIFMFPNAGCC